MKRPSIDDYSIAKTWEHDDKDWEKYANDLDKFIDQLYQSTEKSAKNKRAACYDCGMPYGEKGWIEAVIPDHVWREISPTHNDGGILCISCIARRLEEGNYSPVPVWLCGTERLRVHEGDPSKEIGLLRNYISPKQPTNKLSAEKYLQKKHYIDAGMVWDPLNSGNSNEAMVVSIASVMEEYAKYLNKQP